MCFVDHFSRFAWIYLLKAKSEIYNAFIHFKNLAENQFNTKIKVVQSDWVGEFRNLCKLFTDLGIMHRVSCPHTPEQNRLAERKHRHIVEMGLSLLSYSCLPLKFWDDVFATAVYIINRTPTKTIAFKTPLEFLYKHKPNYNTLETFGCLCFPYLRPYNKHKLQFISLLGIFLGYSSQHKGYKVLLPNGKVVVSRHVIFDEGKFPFSAIKLSS